MKEVCVGISGINATDNPGPGVAVARGLAGAVAGIKLVGLSYDVHDPGNYSPTCSELLPSALSHARLERAAGKPGPGPGPRPA